MHWTRWMMRNIFAGSEKIWSGSVTLHIFHVQHWKLVCNIQFSFHFKSYFKLEILLHNYSINVENLGTKPLFEMLSLQFSWLPTVMSQRLREDERSMEFSTEIFINQRIMLIIRAFTLINIVDSFCGAVQKNRNNLNLPRTIQRTRVLPQMLMSMVTLKRMVQTPSINPPPASRDLVIIVVFSSGLIRSQLLKQ